MHEFDSSYINMSKNEFYLNNVKLIFITLEILQSIFFSNFFYKKEYLKWAFLTKGKHIHNIKRLKYSSKRDEVEPSSLRVL